MVDPELLFQQGFQSLGIAGGNNEIEIKADQRFAIRVDALPADNAISNVAACQQGDQRFEEVRSVHNYRFPKLNRLHSSFGLTWSDAPVSALLRNIEVHPEWCGASFTLAIGNAGQR